MTNIDMPATGTTVKVTALYGTGDTDQFVGVLADYTTEVVELTMPYGRTTVAREHVISVKAL